MYSIVSKIMLLKFPVKGLGSLWTRSPCKWKSLIVPDFVKFKPIHQYFGLKTTLGWIFPKESSQYFKPIWYLLNDYLYSQLNFILSSLFLPSLDCLTSFIQVEELAETELYYCNNCKSKQRSTKRFWIRRLPNVSYASFDIYMKKSKQVEKFKFAFYFTNELLS